MSRDLSPSTIFFLIVVTVIGHQPSLQMSPTWYLCPATLRLARVTGEASTYVIGVSTHRTPSIDETAVGLHNIHKHDFVNTAFNYVAKKRAILHSGKPI